MADPNPHTPSDGGAEIPGEDYEYLHLTPDGARAWRIPLEEAVADLGTDDPQVIREGRPRDLIISPERFDSVCDTVTAFRNTALTAFEQQGRAHRVFERDPPIPNDGRPHFVVDTPNGEAGLMFDDEVLKEMVRRFVFETVVDTPDEFRRVTVAVFSHTMPGELTLEVQSDLGDEFQNALAYQQLDPVLADDFWSFMPPAIEMMVGEGQDDGELEIADLEDVVVPPRRIWEWFEPSMAVPCKPHLNETSEFSQTSAGAQIRRIYEWGWDLMELQQAFSQAATKMRDMLLEIGPVAPVTEEAVQVAAEMLENNTAALLTGQFLNPSHVAAYPEQVDWYALNYAGFEAKLGYVIDRTFFAERVLCQLEDALMPTNPLKASASRYERTRYRFKLLASFASLATMQLRETYSYIPTTDLPPPVFRAFDFSETKCSICLEELPEEGEIVEQPPVVSFNCCNKGFHTDCLLEWAFGKWNQDMPCPMCRTPLGLEVLGSMLEHKVRELRLI
jgi:hypothetical protein